MSWVSKILTGGAAELTNAIVGGLDKFIQTKEEKDDAALRVSQLLYQQFAQLEETFRAQLKAKERIIVAELQQGDNFTKRMRPTIGYVGLGAIVLNHVVIPLVQLLMGKPIEPIMLPTEFWVAWGGYVATYSLGRSVEKRGTGGKIQELVTGNKVLNLAGD